MASVFVLLGKWCQQPTVGKSPPPCSQCTFTQVDKRRAVLFGGSQLKNNCVPNDVYILDLKSWVSWNVVHDLASGCTLSRLLGVHMVQNSASRQVCMMHAYC